MPTPSLRRLGALFACSVLLVAGCGDDEEPAAGDPGAPSSTANPADGPTTTDVAPQDEGVEVCSLLNAETVGSILQEEVTPQPAPTGGCVYAGSSAASLYPLVTVVPDTTGEGLGAARSAAQASVSTTVEDVTVGGLPAYLALDGAKGAIGTVKDGEVVTIVVTGGEPSSNGPILTQLLEHTLDALS